MRRKSDLIGLAAVCVLWIGGSGCVATDTSSSATVFTLQPTKYGQALKHADGRVVFEYMTKKPRRTNLAANSVCCFHPLYTPSGVRVTDLAPGDHHHHRGVFLAWHTMEFWDKADFSDFGPTGPTHGWDIARGDFWGWGQYAPTEGVVIKNRHIKPILLGVAQAEIKIVNDWSIGDQVKMHETVNVAVHQKQNAYVLDLDYQLTPLAKLVLNETSFGGFCVRARNDGESHYYSPEGRIELPDPHYSVPELNWPAAEWYDYTIQLEDGKAIGVTVIDHPDNPPTTWHNPRYIWMINPCIVDKGPVTVQQGETLLFRYRLVVHDGPKSDELIQALSAEWRNQ